MACNRPVTSVAFVSLLALAASPAVSLGAAPQPPAAAPPVSVERIREELSKPAPLPLLDTPLPPPTVTFKSGVEERVFVLTLEQQLHKEFDLRGLQKQSAEWAAMCCGIDINLVIKEIEEALKRRKVRKIREQIARELAELEAARKK